MSHLKTLTTFFFVLQLTAFPATPLLAQPVPGGDEGAQAETWQAHFGAQMRDLLRSGDSARIDAAMQLMMRYKQNSDLTIDFSPAVPVLFDIYEDDEQLEGRRLLALATLEAVGGEATLERLAERVQRGEERSQRVRNQTLRVLAFRAQAGRR